MSHPILQSPTRTTADPTANLDWRPAWVQQLTDDGPFDISVCIANWNCKDYLRRCLESLHDLPQGVRVETIVVDNASVDGAADMVEHEFPEVVLVRNMENRGFACASNQAAARARGEYVLFLNNDTFVPAGVLKQMFDFAEQHPEYGMVGPRLRDGDGIPQISYRQRPTLAALLHKTILLRWTRLFRRAYRDYRRNGFSATQTRDVEVLMGAAVLMRRDVFEQSGGWDEGYRFGGEDIDLSTRVGREHRLAYLADVEITHYGRVSSRQNIGFAAPNVTIGYVHYFRKMGVHPVMLFGYKLLLTIDTPLQLASKTLEYGWRCAMNDRERATKSRVALAGVWHFLRRELVRFWKA